MDQLGQKLLYTTLELEKLKSEAMEEMRKNNDYVSNLIHLLKSAIQERDEARSHLQKLITAAAAVNSPTMTMRAKSEIFPAIDDNNPHLKPAKANSSITESNSLSETHNYHSHGGSGGGGSSPVVDSLFDAASPPEFSNMNPFVQDSGGAAPFQNSNEFSNFSNVQIITMPKLDRGSMIVDSLVKGRALPQKGMLLQAVLQAGPLLQTLMVAGPLPRWRNPPQMQPFQIPPVAIKGGGDAALRQLGSSNCYDIAPNMSDFGGNANSVNDASLISSAVRSNGCFRLPKRQRFC